MELYDKQKFKARQEVDTYKSNDYLKFREIASMYGMITIGKDEKNILNKSAKT